MVSKEVRKASFRVILLWIVPVVQGEVTLVDLTLRVDLYFKLGVKRTPCFRASMGWDVVEEGPLHLVLLIVEADSWKLTLKRCGLPQAAKALGVGSAVWLGEVYWGHRKWHI